MPSDRKKTPIHQFASRRLGGPVHTDISRDIGKVKKLLDQAPTKSIEPPLNKRRKVVVEVEEDESTSGGEDDTEIGWINYQGCLLTDSDKEAILINEFLNDRHINYAQSLLHYQFATIEGLQNTLFQNKQRPKKITHGIQIIHDRGNHWIVAYIPSSGEPVEVYDSVYSTVNDVTAGVIKNLFEITDESKINMKKMQRQIGATDCGVFAIAVCTALLHDSSVDMSQIRFHQEKMRDHLVTCFTDNLLTPFPIW